MTERLNGTQTIKHDDSEHDETGRNGAEKLAGEHVGEILVDAAAGKWAQGQRNAEVNRAGGDGRHDRLQAAIDDDRAVDRAAQRADQQHRHQTEAVCIGEPTTIHDATQLVRTKIMPTERSMPAVSTTSVCAMATKASSTPLFDAVCTTLVVKPAG